MENNFPNASEFSPNVIELDKLLELCKKNEGKPHEFINDVQNTFFLGKAEKSQKALVGNCRSALVAYGILNKGKIELTKFGEELYSERSDSKKFYEMLAKYILLKLNGLVLIDTIKDMNKASEKVSNESVITNLKTLGFEFAKSGKRINTMKLWLAKAEVFEGNSWRINHVKLEELVGLKKEELECFRDLSKEQICFIKALNNTRITTLQKANGIRDLASASYKISFSEKSFVDNILNPLRDKGLLNLKKATTGRGGKSTLVSPTEKMLLEVTIPYLNQIEKLTSKEMTEFFKLPTKEILEKIQSVDKHIKGTALEALAYKLMKSIGLTYVSTRSISVDTGGAEVDLIFESTTLVYTRWQIQCKNSAKVELEAIAKEVGVTPVLKSNVIVMIGTGTVTDPARQYAKKVMENSNLCIILIDGNDLQKISDNPVAIIDVFNRESNNVRNIKLLDLK